MVAESDDSGGVAWGGVGAGIAVAILLIIAAIVIFILYRRKQTEKAANSSGTKIYNASSVDMTENGRYNPPPGGIGGRPPSETESVYE